MDKEVYVFGSYHGNSRASEYYIIDKNEWVELPLMPVENGGIWACALQDNCIFLVGYYMKWILKFDLVAREFSEISCNLTLSSQLYNRCYKSIWAIPNDKLLYSDQY